MSEDMWRERAQSAEAKFKTAMNSIDAANQRVQDIKKAFGIKERFGGQYSIDFAALVESLGPDQSAELRSVIDEKFGPAVLVTAEKPKMRVKAGSRRV